MTATTMEKPIAPIEFIKGLAVQPRPEDVRRIADENASKLRKEVAGLIAETKKSLGSLNDECDPEILRLKKILETLDSPLERATKRRVACEISRLTRDKNNRQQSLTQKLKSKKVHAERSIRETTSVSDTKTALLPKYPFVTIKEIPWLKNTKPQIIPIHESDPAFTISAYVSDDDVTNSSLWWGSGEERREKKLEKLLDTLGKIFTPHIKKWKSEATGYGGYRKQVQYTFTGSIPRETKSAMRKARPDFKEGCLLMLADASTLHVSRTIKRNMMPVNKDPLIVGYHPKTPDLFWLIAAFDMTPIEKIISDKALKGFWKQKKEKKGAS